MIFFFNKRAAAVAILCLWSLSALSQASTSSSVEETWDKVVISSNGAWIAGITSKKKLYVTHVSSKEQVEVAQAIFPVEQLGISGDGSCLVYQEKEKLQLFRYQKEKETWQEKPFFYCSTLIRFQFSSKNSLIAYYLEEKATRWQGFSYNLATEERRKLPSIPEKELLAISLQGKLLLRDKPSCPEKLYLCDASGTTQFWHSKKTISDDVACFSPAGSYLMLHDFTDHPFFIQGGIYATSQTYPKNALSKSPEKKIWSISWGTEEKTFLIGVTRKRKRYAFWLWDVEEKKKRSRDYYIENDEGNYFYVVSCPSCVLVVYRKKIVVRRWLPNVLKDKKVIYSTMKNMYEDWPEGIADVIAAFSVSKWRFEFLWEKDLSSLS